MKARLVAVGKAPAWVDEGCAEYASRLPRECSLELHVVVPRRNQSDEQRLLAEVRRHEMAVVFDARGKDLTSSDFAATLADWRMAGRDLALLIGGADGFSAAALRRADQVMSLSRLTFPHQLTRVIVAEQFYRAWTMLAGHPYHRAQAAGPPSSPASASSFARRSVRMRDQGPAVREANRRRPGRARQQGGR